MDLGAEAGHQLTQPQPGGLPLGTEDEALPLLAEPAPVEQLIDDPGDVLRSVGEGGG